ncbi:hypothetical protein DPEC_G00065330 [Dallia pectoralis]|uniref:Uncharacterized protein n=1 Tax=Dallia pectoralis TaxID=75939 RepID=A0ACC2H7Z3_DALPE|nr:hypothetical protein DPEC_G00065330 [Dallia pectoralis]
MPPVSQGGLGHIDRATLEERVPSGEGSICVTLGEDGGFAGGVKPSQWKMPKTSNQPCLQITRRLRTAAAKEGWRGSAQNGVSAKACGRWEPQWQLGRAGRPAVEQQDGAGVTGRCHHILSPGRTETLVRYVLESAQLQTATDPTGFSRWRAITFFWFTVSSAF